MSGRWRKSGESPAKKRTKGSAPTSRGTNGQFTSPTASTRTRSRTGGGEDERLSVLRTARDDAVDAAAAAEMERDEAVVQCKEARRKLAALTEEWQIRGDSFNTKIKELEETHKAQYAELYGNLGQVLAASRARVTELTAAAGSNTKARTKLETRLQYATSRITRLTNENQRLKGEVLELTNDIQELANSQRPKTKRAQAQLKGSTERGNPHGAYLRPSCFTCRGCCLF